MSDSMTRYKLNYEALARVADPIATLESLLDLDRDWDREFACISCEAWQPDRGLTSMPRRPGNPNCLVSCAGCHYALLDELWDRPKRTKGDAFPRQLDQPHHPPPVHTENRPCRPRKRVFLLEGSEIRWEGGRLRARSVVAGYSGPRRHDRANTKAASFRQRWSFVEPVEPCPKCQVPSSVERYWWTGGRGEQPVACQMLSCAKCGRFRRRERLDPQPWVWATSPRSIPR